MADRPNIAVIDDGGELDDVRGLLDEIGLEYTSWTKESVPPAAQVGRLMVVTASLAVTLRYQRPTEGGESPTWVAVSSNDSRTQRTLLLQAGFDYLVRRPVHPTALRLLLQRALFRGDDQRRGRRVAVGYGVTLRTGLIPRRAILVDLSATGARVLACKGLERGTRVTMRIPGAIDDGAPFTLLCRVVRTRRGDAEGGVRGEVSLALRFLRVDAAQRDRLRRLLSTLAAGPASMPDKPAPEAAAESVPAREPRAVYEREVVIFGSGGCALMGRDLSPGGMCVEQHPALSVGEKVRLAIPGVPPEEPVIVNARVVRDDGARGLGLIFESVEGGEEDRLERIVARHPVIESLASDASGKGIVVSNILPSLQRIAEQSRGWTSRLRRG